MELKQKQTKIVTVGESLLAMGLAFAGIKESYTPESAEQAEAVLAELLDRKDVGIVIVTEGIVAQIRDKRLRNRIDNSIMPVVLQVPGYNEQEKYSDTLRKLIIRAIGIDIMQKGAKGNSANA